MLSDDKLVFSAAASQSLGIKMDSLNAHLPWNKDGGVDKQTKKAPSPLPPYKKRHRGCSYCILDIENASIPEFPPNEEVVGVITMEDVIEELLQVMRIALI